MTTTKIAITYALADAYRRERFAAGEKLAREQTVEVEVTAEEFFALGGFLSGDGEAVPMNLRIVADGWREDRVEAEATGLLDSMCNVTSLVSGEVALDLYRKIRDGAIAGMDRRAEERQRDAEERERDNEARQAEAQRREAERVAKAAAKRGWLRAWIEENGTASQRQRQAAGVLGEEEALEMLEDDTFAAIAAMPYVRLLDGDARHQRHCVDPEISFRSGDEEAVTEDQWSARNAIFLQAPVGATCTVRWHEVRCDPCSRSTDEPDTTSHSILVRVERGPWSLAREYACPS